MSEKKRWKLIHYLGYAIPLLLVVYVLSIGPVYAVFTNSVLESHNNTNPISKRMDYRSFDSFYAPVFWVENRSRFIDEILNDYREYCFIKMYPDYLSLYKESSFHGNSEAP